MCAQVHACILEFQQTMNEHLFSQDLREIEATLAQLGHPV